MYVELPAVPGITPSGIMRASDGAIIPADPRNTDWTIYLAWLKAGNTPGEGAAPPAPPPAKTAPEA